MAWCVLSRALFSVQRIVSAVRTRVCLCGGDGIFLCAKESIFLLVVVAKAAHLFLSGVFSFSPRIFFFFLFFRSLHIFIFSVFYYVAENPYL